MKSSQKQRLKHLNSILNKRTQMLYIILGGKKQNLNKEIVEKYSLKPGMRTLFTGFNIFENNEKEGKIIKRNPQIHQAPEDDNSKIGQG